MVYVFMQEDIGLHLQDKESQADIVCCLHHLQVSVNYCFWMFLLPGMYSLMTLHTYICAPVQKLKNKETAEHETSMMSFCSFALRQRTKQRDCYITSHLCWNQEVIFSVLPLTHLLYGMHNKFKTFFTSLQNVMYTFDHIFAFMVSFPRY